MSGCLCASSRCIALFYCVFNFNETFGLLKNYHLLLIYIYKRMCPHIILIRVVVAVSCKVLFDANIPLR